MNNFWTKYMYWIKSNSAHRYSNLILIGFIHQLRTHWSRTEDRYLCEEERNKQLCSEHSIFLSHFECFILSYFLSPEWENVLNSCPQLKGGNINKGIEWKCNNFIPFSVEGSKVNISGFCIFKLPVYGVFIET